MLQIVRFEATAHVAEMRKGSVSVAVFGTSKPLRRQSTVSVLAKSRRVQVAPVGAQKPVAHGAPGTPLAAEQQGETTEAAEEQVPSPVPERAGGSEWVLTLQAKYLHKIQLKDEEVHTACAWRKGPERRRPIDPKRIIWRGDVGAARAMRIECCLAGACQFD